jgi:V8-like Glu-specific endopeptidase
MNRQFDIALITLASPIGDAVFGGRRLGWWGDTRGGGDTRQTVLATSKLNGTAANVSGYPADKCNGAQLRDEHACTGAAQHPASPTTCAPIDRGSTQWRSFATIRQPVAPGAPGMIRYEMDTEGGHSGSPVWLRWKSTRWLLGIHRGVDCTSGFNEAVRMTDALWTLIRSWM